MNDDQPPFSDERMSATRNPIQASLSADPATRPAPAAGPAAFFTGRTPRRIEAVRAGMIVGTGLLLAIGAAVAMGASPAPSGSSGTDLGRTIPREADGTAGDGAGSGGFGPFDAELFGDLGKGWGQGGRGDRGGHGFGRISVTAIDGSSLSLATVDGWARTIDVTDTTMITKGGAAARLSDIAVGDSIRFNETRNADGTFTIRAIAIVQPHVAGTVTAVAPDTITLTLHDGTSQTIKTNGSTTYHVERADGERTDVAAGSTIVATGARAADGSLTATSVWVRLPHAGGTVSATSTDTITITKRDGTTLTAHVGTGTTYRIPGVANPTLSDVKAGMEIVVEGSQRADGSLDATAVAAGNLKGRGHHDGPPGLDPNHGPAPDASGGTTG